VGLNVPETSCENIGNVEVASSSNVSTRFVTLYLFCPPAFAITIVFCPCGPTSRISASLGNPWVNPNNVTVALVTTCPVNPETDIEDGYGVAGVGGVKLSLNVITFAFENVTEAARIEPAEIAKKASQQNTPATSRLANRFMNGPGSGSVCYSAPCGKEQIDVAVVGIPCCAASLVRIVTMLLGLVPNVNCILRASAGMSGAPLADSNAGSGVAMPPPNS